LSHRWGDIPTRISARAQTATITSLFRAAQGIFANPATATSTLANAKHGTFVGEADAKPLATARWRMDAIPSPIDDKPSVA